VCFYFFFFFFYFGGWKIGGGGGGVGEGGGGGEYRRLKFGKKFEKVSRIKLKGINKSSTG